MDGSTIWEAVTWGRERPSWVWPALGPLLTAVIYYLGAEVAFAIGTLTQEFAPFWPPNVVLLCALLLSQKRYWPLYIAAAFPAHVLAEQGVAMPVAQLLAAFGCNVGLSVLNAIALTNLLRGPAPLCGLPNASLYLLFAVLINPALVAIGAGFEPSLGGGDPQFYWQFWWRWYLANALGNLTLTPVFLTWFLDGTRPWSQMPGRGRIIEGALLIIGLVISCTVAFNIPVSDRTEAFFPAVFYLPIPLFLAATVRFGGRGASGAILIITVMVLFRSMHGLEPMAEPSQGQGVLSVQLFLSVFAVPGILLAALVEELQRTNARLSAVLDGISDRYYTLDREGRVVAINAKAAAWYGNRRPAELIGRRFWDLAGERAPERSWVRGAMQSDTAVSGEIASPDGRWLQMHAYPSAAGLSIFCHDVTEQRLAEQAAQSTQDLLQSSLDALNAQVAILDASGKIIAANAAWQRAADLLLRLGEHYFVGDNYVEECEQARLHQREMAAGLRQLMRGEIEQFRGEFASDIVKGTWIQLRGSRFGSDDQLRIVVACEDITEVKAAETSLRRLTGRLLRSQDEAQRRIARELHDATAQNLFGAGLGIGHALRLAPRLNRAAKAALEESRALIEQSQREIRTVSYLLHPPMLDEAGLPAALRWFSEGFAKRTEVTVEIDIDAGIGRLPPDIEAALFRVAQEALTNVHRHSDASRVFVRFRLGSPSEAEQTIVLTIEDNGKGMPPYVLQTLRFGRHLHAQNIGIGLAGMRERLHQFGGDLDINSSPQGTTVRATVPVRAFSEVSEDPSDADVKSAPTAMN